MRYLTILLLAFAFHLPKRTSYGPPAHTEYAPKPTATDVSLRRNRLDNDPKAKSPVNSTPNSDVMHPPPDHYRAILEDVTGENAQKTCAVMM